MTSDTPASAQPGAPPLALARAVLDAAAEVEAAEAAIKNAILDAAAREDCDRVAQIVTRWLSMPAAEVLGPQAGSSPLD